MGRAAFHTNVFFMTRIEDISEHFVTGKSTFVVALFGVVLRTHNKLNTTILSLGNICQRKQDHYTQTTCTVQLVKHQIKG